MNAFWTIAAKIAWSIAKPILIRSGQHLRDKWAADISAIDKKKAGTP